MSVYGIGGDGRVRVDGAHSGVPPPHFLKQPIWEAVAQTPRAQEAVKAAFSLCVVTGEPQDIPIPGDVLHIRKTDVPLSVIAWTDNGREPRPPFENPLSPREMDMVHHLADGLTLKQVAVTMDVSERWVGKILASIYRKTGTQTPFQIAVWATRNGLL